MGTVWIAFTAGIFLGAVAGATITCFMVIAGRTSRETEEMEARCEMW